MSLCVAMPPFFSQSPADGHQGISQSGCDGKAAVNVCESPCGCFHFPRVRAEGRMAGFCGTCRLVFLGNWQTVFLRAQLWTAL